MQVLLTLTAELLVIVVAGAMVFDFMAGLLHLYNTSIPTPQGKQETEPLEERATEPPVLSDVLSESLRGAKPTPTAYKETTKATEASLSISSDSCRPVVEDPWESEVEVMSQCFCCHGEIAPTIYLLPPAIPEVIDQPRTVDYSWSIRALKKEAQRRQLKRYSSLTKSQLITALTPQ